MPRLQREVPRVREPAVLQDMLDGDRDHRDGEYGGVDVHDEEGLVVGVVGEYVLDSMKFHARVSARLFSFFTVT